jgi:hypothetical protein
MEPVDATRLCFDIGSLIKLADGAGIELTEPPILSRVVSLAAERDAALERVEEARRIITEAAPRPITPVPGCDCYFCTKQIKRPTGAEAWLKATTRRTK